VVLKSAAATKRWGEAFATELQPGQLVCLSGALGAGKTTLVQSIAKGLGVNEPVTSPSYTLINQYSGRCEVVHLDLYRLSGPQEFEQIGGWDALASGAISFLEWPERLGEELPSQRWDLRLELAGKGRRLFVEFLS